MSVSDEVTVVLNIGKKYGIDEAIDIYPSKVDVKNWVSAKCKYCCPNSRPACWQTAIPPEELKRILDEYRRAVMVIGKGTGNFRDAILEMETELYKKGFYKAFALINGVPETTEQGKQRPTISGSGIDLLSLIRRFKKNTPPFKLGDCPPWAIILIE